MLGTDEHLLSVLEKIKARPKIPTRTMVKEAVGLLLGAPCPKPNSLALIKARSQLYNDRSKLIDMRIEILRELETLKQARKELDDFLTVKYMNHLDSIKTNARGREAMIAKPMQPISKLIAELESALKSISDVIGDNDSKSYGIRDIIAAIQVGEREA